jgi:tetratricopeptide (TPR) repeat protein
MSFEGQVALALVAILLGPEQYQDSIRVRPESRTDSLKMCDHLYRTGDLSASESVARSIVSRQANSYDALWRLSRAIISRSNIELDKHTSRQLLKEGFKYANSAIQIQPEGAEGFTCIAICAGNLSSLEGGKTKIEWAEIARDAAEYAIELDDRNDLAYLVLGIWNREVASLGGFTRLAAKIFYGGAPSGASIDQSESYLRRAIEIEPEFLNHHRELGITLMHMKRYEEAVREFETGLKLTSRGPEDHMYRADIPQRLNEARKQMERMGGEKKESAR